MKTALRWLAAILALPVGLAAGWLASQLVVGVADGRCPAESQIGGACVAAWHTDWVAAALFLGLFVATVLLVLLPFLIAPALKRLAAAVGFVVALAAPVALFAMTGWPDLLWPIGFVLIVGAVVLGIVWRRKVDV